MVSSGDDFFDELRLETQLDTGEWTSIMAVQRDEGILPESGVPPYIIEIDAVPHASLWNPSGISSFTTKCFYNPDGLLCVTNEICETSPKLIDGRDALIAAGHFTVLELKKHYSHIDFGQTVKKFLGQLTPGNFDRPMLFPATPQLR